MKSPWWEKQAKLMGKEIGKLTPEEAVIYAQTECHFDHRKEYDESIIQESECILIEDFKNHYPPLFTDSKYSWKPSMDEDGKSDMFLMHLYFYMRIMNILDEDHFHPFKPKRILEIGAGYGETARIFTTLHPEIEYHIIDFEESLFFSKAYHSLNKIDDVIYLIPEDIGRLKGDKFDLVINTLSCQEMLPEEVNKYVKFIENDIDVDYFYWLNYIRNKPSVELSYDKFPPIDGNWTSVYAKYNPEIMKVTSPRNYLELLLRRNK